MVLPQRLRAAVGTLDRRGPSTESATRRQRPTGRPSPGQLWATRYCGWSGAAYPDSLRKCRLRLSHTSIGLLSSRPYHTPACSSHLRAMGARLLPHAPIADRTNRRQWGVTSGKGAERLSSHRWVDDLASLVHDLSRPTLLIAVVAVACRRPASARSSRRYLTASPRGPIEVPRLLIRAACLRRREKTRYPDAGRVTP